MIIIILTYIFYICLKFAQVIFFSRSVRLTIQIAFRKEGAINTLRPAFAMEAGRGIFIKTHERPDRMITARALRAAIEQDGKPDIVFTGKEAIDSEGMQTMYRLVPTLDMLKKERLTGQRARIKITTVLS